MVRIIDADHIKRKVEEMLGKNEKYSKLCRVVRKIASRNPYKGAEYAMWEEQCFVNYPILYLGSIYLYLYAKQKKKRLFLFATRDGCHWHKIFEKIFPGEKICYFDCSRIMFDRTTKNPKGPGPTAYVQYIRSVMEKYGERPETSIYVDIHGSGHRMFAFFERQFREVPDCFLLTARFPSYDRAANICQKYHKLGRFLNISFEMGGGPIEMLNYDLIGTLQNFYMKGDVPTSLRERLEYKKEMVMPYHRAMEALIAKTKTLSTDKVRAFKMSDLDRIIKGIFEEIGTSLPIIAKRFAHLSHHDMKDLPVASETTKTNASVDIDTKKVEDAMDLTIDTAMDPTKDDENTAKDEKEEKENVIIVKEDKEIGDMEELNSLNTHLPGDR